MVSLVHFKLSTKQMRYSSDARDHANSQGGGGWNHPSVDEPMCNAIMSVLIDALGGLDDR